MFYGVGMCFMGCEVIGTYGSGGSLGGRGWLGVVMVFEKVW